MYKDEIWYRKFEQAIDAHRDDFDDKQWKKYHIDYLLHLGKRIKESSDNCETCQNYQHALTRLEEEILELSGSKAQRQYQLDQFAEISRHFINAHQLVPKGYYMRKWLRSGLYAGSFIGVAIFLFVTGNLLHWVLAMIVVAGSGAIYGLAEDDRVKREHRVL